VAEALADVVDRKKLLLVMNLWLAIAAGALAVLRWLHLLSTHLVLVVVFLIAVGFAFEAPAWTSIVPEIVSTSELPSAATLGGLQLNISGILGPAIGGFLLPFIGASSVFAVNAACFLAVGGGTARDAELGKRSYERNSNDGLSRGACDRRCNLGLGGHDDRSSIQLIGGSGIVVGKSRTRRSAFDRLYRESELEPCSCH
jgi:MFS family permease